LDLIEKNGGIHPFCKARSGSGDSIVITPDDAEYQPLEAASVSLRSLRSFAAKNSLDDLAGN